VRGKIGDASKDERSGIENPTGLLVCKRSFRPKRGARSRMRPGDTAEGLKWLVAPPGKTGVPCLSKFSEGLRLRGLRSSGILAGPPSARPFANDGSERTSRLYSVRLLSAIGSMVVDAERLLPSASYPVKACLPERRSPEPRNYSVSR
jgi:hypothetical protein